MNYLVLQTCYNILIVDLYKYYKKTFVDDIMNKAIWVTCLLAVTAYVWPSVGMSESFGVFSAIGAIVSCCFWDSWGLSAQFIADLDGNRLIDYYCTLPVSAWLLFTTRIVFYAIRSMVPALIVIPVSKLVLWSKFDLTGLLLAKFLVIFVLICFFCATLSLFMTSLVRDMSSIDNISVRFLFPIWFLGGFNFSWQTLHAVSPMLAYANLFNPLVYAMEGIRVAFLGQTGYLPFWACVGALILFSFVFGYCGTRRLIKRLDCV